MVELKGSRVIAGAFFINTHMIPSVATTNDFHALRNNSVWLDADMSDKAPALYKSSDYIRATWCVDGHEDDDTVVEAVMMLAPEMLAAPVRIQAGEREVLSEERGYGNGAVETKTTYAKSTSNDPYPLISLKLARYGKRRESPNTGANTLTLLRLVRS